MSVFPRLSVCLHKPYGSLTKLVIPIILKKYLNVMSAFEGEKWYKIKMKVGQEVLFLQIYP